MIAFNHALVGAAIGSQSNSLPAIVILGIISHFALDALPHLDQGTEIDDRKAFRPFIKYSLAALDIAFTGIIIYLILVSRPDLNKTNVAVGAFSAMLFDFIFNVPFWEKWVSRPPILGQIYKFHNKVHEPLKKYQFILGIPIQIILIVVCLWFLLK